MLVSHDRDFLDRVATSTLAFEGNGKWIEYAGGYSDFLIQRGAPAAAEAVKGKSAARPAALAQTSGAKMSFKELHELKQLSAAIEALQAEIKRHEARLAEPQLYSRDNKAFQAATAALAAAAQKLAAAEERWLELEMRKEAS